VAEHHFGLTLDSFGLDHELDSGFRLDGLGRLNGFVLRRFSHSLAAARTGSGGGRAARRRPTVVATGLRRGACTTREEGI